MAALSIAGQTVGPVWFESRPAGTSRRGCRARPIVGALGGNALGFFRVTIDYPHGQAVFENA